MRYFTLFIFLFFTQFSYSQSILKKKISLDVKNQSLEKTLDLISKKGGFYFSYNSNIINQDSIVSYICSKKTVELILKDILPENIVLLESGKHLILKSIVVNNSSISKKENTEKQKYIIRGYLINSITGEKIESATVYQVGQTNSVLTDVNGAFELSVSTKKDRINLAFSRNMFKDTVIVIEPNGIDFQINLVPEQDFSVPIHENRLKPIPIDNQLDNIKFVNFAVPKKQKKFFFNTQFSEYKLAQVSFLPILGTNSKMSGLVTNKFSFNVLGGYSYAVSKFEFGGLFNIVQKNVEGFQLAGLTNITGGKTNAIQISGVANNNRASVKGIQLAGFYNIVLDTLNGLQIAGFANILHGKMQGIQLSGFSNFTTQNVDGLQLAGFSNYAHGDVLLSQVSGFANWGKNVGGAQVSSFANVAQEQVSGLQLAGFANYARQVNTLQLAGFANLALERVHGAQIAGFFNYAKQVDGFQLAFINISDTLSGLGIGFFNYSNKGFHKIDISASENFHTRIAFKTGVARFYNIFAFGYQFQSQNTFSLGYGFGNQIWSSKKNFLSLEFLSSHISENNDFFAYLNLLNELNINYTRRFFQNSLLLIGPSFNFFLSAKQNELNEYNSNFAPYSLYNSENEYFKFNFWIGARISISI